MQIDAAPIRTKILDFIMKSQGSQFVIPVYQRNYTWVKNNEIAKLLSDLDILLANKDNNHFLGILMYLPKQINFSFSEFQVIDGQQRLTTIFLILLAIRKIAEENNDSKTAEIINEFYLFNKFSDDSNKFRMKPLVSDDEVFQKILNNDFNFITESEKTSNIYSNFIYIENYIKDNLIKYQLNDIIDALQRFYIVSIPLVVTDNPQQIFESINSTGAPLTSADLIRNYILMNHTDKVQEDLYTNYWKKIENIEPNSKKLEEIIRQYLAVKLFQLPNKNNIYNEFKNFWNENEEDDIKTKLNDIYNYVFMFDEIYNSDSLDDKIQESILEFRKISSQIPASILMETLILYKNKQINSDQVNSIFSIINTYLIRRALVDLDTSNITRLFPTILKHVLDTCNGDYSNIVDILSYFLIKNNANRKMFMPTDKQLKTYLKENNAYSISHIRIVLEKIENSENLLPLEKLNIEHIMPQTTNDYWRDKTGLNDLEYAHYTNLLGNLTLVSSKDNSKMGNKNFETKKDILKETSHVKLNTKILDKNEWTIEDINTRTDELINKIITIYPYTDSDYEEEYENEVNIYCKNKNIDAKGLFVNENKIILLKESSFKVYDANSVNSSSIEDINDLLKENIIEENDGKLIFVKDYEFGSLSGAANLLTGWNNNGWDFWKLDNGNTISSIRNNVSQDDYYTKRDKLIDAISEILMEIAKQDSNIIYFPKDNSNSYIRFSTPKLKEYFTYNSTNLSHWENNTYAYYELKIRKNFIHLQIAFDIENTNENFKEKIFIFENELRKQGIVFTSNISSSYHLINIKDKIKNDYMGLDVNNKFLSTNINNILKNII